MATALLKDSDYRALFEGAPGHYLVVTRDFKVIAASDAFLLAVKKRREAVLEREVFEVLPDDGLRASLRRVLRHGRPDGMNYPVLGEGRRVAFIIHRADEGERGKKLRDTVAYLEAFSHTIAHDLRAPLRAMEAYSRILLSRLGPTASVETLDLLERIKRAALWMDRLTQDVLDYSRVAREEVVVGPVDLQKVVTETIEHYASLLKTARVRVRRPLLPVMGQESLLSQCLGNLLDNAIKFTPEDREPDVEIGTEARHGKVRLWVTDNGSGIEPAHLDRIFLPFERLQPKAGAKGTGIGLAVVKLAVERMGGRIGAESIPGDGSRFWLELDEAPR